MPNHEIQELLNRISVFDKMYEQIRIVDPIENKVINQNNGELIETDTKCFAFWNTNRVCENCISMRAILENNTFVKVEYTKDNLYMITAIPFELPDRRIVIELLKDVTNSFIFEVNGANGEVTSELHTMIDNMNDIAMKDALTGVYNRRFMNEKLPIDMTNSVLADQQLSIILTDIDFFKNVNDTYGHLIGDCALKTFTEKLSECLQRDSDWVARYGGEEFLICLPGAELEKAVKVAELIRKTIENWEFKCNENTFHITASFGIYSGKPNRGERIENLIQFADEKLYRAKHNGRNQVEY